MIRAVGIDARHDLLPLSQRVTAMMAMRLVLTTVAAIIGQLAGVPPGRTWWVLAALYLTITTVLSGCALVLERRWAVHAFGSGLLVDGAFLQFLHESAGYGAGADVIIAVQLMTVCLLVSFRSGLKLALWQTLLMTVALSGKQTGLFPMGPEPVGSAGESGLFIDWLLIWLVTVAASSAGAMNERELRRRRYDAEVLQRFAEQLHSHKRREQVADELCAFVTEELQASRALVCERTSAGLKLIAPRGLADGAPAAGVQTSAFLDLAMGPEREVLALRLDPRRDPWLTAVLPSARRLIGIRLHAGGRGTWLVLEHAVRRGSRVEQRMITTAAQAAATTALALARALLLEQAERAASLDGLTGLANRRTFDAQLAGLDEAHRRRGVGFALMLIDVDRFKSINDNYGHPAGDAVLQAVARTIAETCRPGDLPARYGGEEFAVLLPDTDADRARRVAERIRLALYRVQAPTPVRASFGVAAVPQDAADPVGLVQRADRALLHAKETGRDRVVCGSAVEEVAADPAEVDRTGESRTQVNG